MPMDNIIITFDDNSLAFSANKDATDANKIQIY